MAERRRANVQSQRGYFIVSDLPRMPNAVGASLSRYYGMNRLPTAENITNAARNRENQGVLSTPF